MAHEKNIAAITLRKALEDHGIKLPQPISQELIRKAKDSYRLPERQAVPDFEEKQQLIENYNYNQFGPLHDSSSSPAHRSPSYNLNNLD